MLRPMLDKPLRPIHTDKTLAEMDALQRPLNLDVRESNNKLVRTSRVRGKAEEKRHSAEMPQKSYTSQELTKRQQRSNKTIRLPISSMF